MTKGGEGGGVGRGLGVSNRQGGLSSDIPSHNSFFHSVEHFSLKIDRW
jgi:hypothetical protein